MFEDIDNTFEGRNSTRRHSYLTFDCLLNLISGVDNSDGVIVVITTNNISKVDSALGGSHNGTTITSRPGRVDHIVEFGALKPDERIKIIQRIASGYPNDWDRMVEETHEMMGAQVQEVATRFALSKFWEQQNGEKDEREFKEKD